MRFIAQEVREIMAQLGFRTMNEMVGRADRLEVRQSDRTLESARVWIFRNILYQPEVPARSRSLLPDAAGPRLGQSTGQPRPAQALRKPAIERNEKVVRATLPIRNVNRVVGTILGSEVTRRYGAEGLPEDTIQLAFQGFSAAKVSARSCRKA